VIAKDLRSGVEQLGNMIAEADCIVPFTGAGISTECGIPDFRSPGGLWTRNRPIAFDEFVSSADARAEAWRLASRPMTSSNCMATPPMHAASAADMPMIFLG
jgi:NAD-dependent SIR2 family protein deacetylase